MSTYVKIFSQLTVSLSLSLSLSFPFIRENFLSSWMNDRGMNDVVGLQSDPLGWRVDENATWSLRYGHANFSFHEKMCKPQGARTRVSSANFVSPINRFPEIEQLDFNFE